MTKQKMPDKFTKRELSERLRKVLDELATVADEIIITYLDETEDADAERNGDKGPDDRSTRH